MDGRLLALLSAFFFSLGPVILSLGLRKASADLAILVSMIIGLPLLLLLSPLLGGVHLNDLTMSTTILFAMGGLLGPLFGRFFLYNGIDRLGSSRAFTVVNTAPLITAVAAFFLLAEVITLWRWVAILLIVAGLAIVGKQANKVPGKLRVSGLLLAFAGALSFGIRPIVLKFGFAEIPDPMTASVVGAAAALVGVTLFLGLSGKLRSLTVDRKSLGLFAMVGALQNLGFLTVNHAFNADDVTLVYPINSSAPLITFALSYFILRNVEQLAVWDFLGTLSVVGGVILLLT